MFTMENLSLDHPARMFRQLLIVSVYLTAGMVDAGTGCIHSSLPFLATNQIG